MNLKNLINLMLASAMTLVRHEVQAEPPFSGTIFIDPDIITPLDPSAFLGVEQAGRGLRWMFDRRVNDNHFWATMNYIHHNPVHHGYAQHWPDWPFSSAREYLENMGKEAAGQIWREYPVLDYGKGWDDPDS